MTASGGVTLNAESQKDPNSTADYRVDALAFGVAASGSGQGGEGVTVALAGAGSSATNTVDKTVAASITNCGGSKSVAADGGGVSLTAGDDTSLRADSGGFAVAIAASGGGGGQGAGALGASISTNSIGQNGGQSVTATIKNSAVKAAGTVSLSATSTATAYALSMGGAGAGAGSGGDGITISPAAAGAGSYNTLTQSIEASIKNGSSVTTGNLGDVTLTAIDSSELKADAGGVAVAIAVSQGGGSGSGSIGAGVANNTLKDSVIATIDSSTVTAAGAVSLTAQSQKRQGSTADYRVDALAFGAAGSLAGQSGAGITVALAGAGSSATNTVDNTIAASITNCGASTPVAANGGGVSLTAGDDTSLRADSGGFAVALAVGLGSGGQGAGTVGASVSTNTIGQHGGQSVKAKIDNSVVKAVGPVTLSATSTATAAALSMGGSLALAASGGTGVTISAALSGAFSYNTLQQTVSANIKDNSSVAAAKQGNTLSGVTLTATDSSELKADAGGVAIAIAAKTGSGGTGSGSVGAAVANNTLSDTVNAAIDSSTVTASGAVSLTAKSQKRQGSTADFRVDALAFGVAASGAGQAGTGITIALAGAGSSATNTVDNSITAAITNTGGTSTLVEADGGGVSLMARDDTSVRGDSGGYAVALAGSLGGGGGRGRARLSRTTRSGPRPASRSKRISTTPWSPRRET